MKISTATSMIGLYTNTNLIRRCPLWEMTNNKLLSKKHYWVLEAKAIEHDIVMRFSFLTFSTSQHNYYLFLGQTFFCCIFCIKQTKFYFRQLTGFQYFATFLFHLLRVSVFFYYICILACYLSLVNCSITLVSLLNKNR